MHKLLFIALAVSCTSVQAGYVQAPVPIKTPWGEKVTPENAWRGYPRPQFMRGAWTNLNGLWQYAVTPDGAWAKGVPTEWAGEILVPFAIESSLSGVGRKLGQRDLLWYRRSFTADVKPGTRLILNVEQADFRAQVLVNGVEAGVPHEGGQVPFSYDVTDLVHNGENELVIAVWDATNDFFASAGKQTLNPGGIWYTRSSGITGTVWLETVPETHLAGVRITPDLDKGRVTVLLDCAGDARHGEGLVEVLQDGKVVASRAVDDWSKAVALNLPRPLRPWSPSSPYLYDLRLTVKNSAAGTTDVVTSYFGLRKIAVQKDAQGVLRVYLNNEPCFLSGTLDQGWWPDGLLTPPSDEAMAFDIKALKDHGFNMMRKHIKVEPRRYYHLCDKMGMMVLQDMPSGGGDAMVRYGLYRRELEEVVGHLVNVPSIVMWIPYNEKWGQPGEFLTHQTLMWVQRHDPTRLVNGPSGANDYEGGELWGPTVRTKHKPHGVEEAAHLVDKHDYSPRPRPFELNDRRASFLGEFGGLGYRVEGHVWSKGGWSYNGDGQTAEAKKVQEKLVTLLDHVARLAGRGMAGSVYTQTTDVEDEQNGLLTYDRRVFKFDVKAVAAANARIYERASRPLAPITRRQLVPRLDPDPQAWRMTTEAPGAGWMKPDYDDSAWRTTAGGVGSRGIVANVNGRAKIATEWTTKRLWMRRTFELAAVPEKLEDVFFELFHDEDTEIWLNGVKVLAVKGWNGGWDEKAVDKDLFLSAVRPGRNVLAASVVQDFGEQYFDAGLVIETVNVTSAP